MSEFFNKHSARLKLIALTRMPVIPYFFYKAAISDSTLILNFFLGLMKANIFLVMKKGQENST